MTMLKAFQWVWCGVCSRHDTTASAPESLSVTDSASDWERVGRKAPQGAEGGAKSAHCSLSLARINPNRVKQSVSDSPHAHGPETRQPPSPPSSSSQLRNASGSSASSSESFSAQHVYNLGRAVAEADQPLRPVWPESLFTPFALVTVPLVDPADFRGRPPSFIVDQVVTQLDAGEAADPKVLLGALSELERLSFKKEVVQQLLQLQAVAVFARALHSSSCATACKAAVILWNCAFQKPTCIADIKATDAVESLARLLQQEGQSAQYAASGCLSVLTAASHTLRVRCAAAGALPPLARCLDLQDSNVQYHAGGALYYIALNEPQLRGEVRAAGAEERFHALLLAPGAPNYKLAKRALACLAQQAP